MRRIVDIALVIFIAVGAIVVWFLVGWMACARLTR